MVLRRDLPGEHGTASASASQPREWKPSATDIAAADFILSIVPPGEAAALAGAWPQPNSRWSRKLVLCQSCNAVWPTRYFVMPSRPDANLLTRASSASRRSRGGARACHPMPPDPTPAPSPRYATTASTSRARRAVSRVGVENVLSAHHQGHDSDRHRHDSRLDPRRFGSRIARGIAGVRAVSG